SREWLERRRILRSGGGVLRAAARPSRATAPATRHRLAHRSPFSGGRTNPAAHICKATGATAICPGRCGLSLTTAPSRQTRPHDDPATVGAIRGSQPWSRGPLSPECPPAHITLCQV